MDDIRHKSIWTVQRLAHQAALFVCFALPPCVAADLTRELGGVLCDFKERKDRGLAITTFT
jgi:hypothetical protein